MAEAQVNYPPRVSAGKGPSMKFYYFDGIAPITGDGLYSYTDDKNNVHSALVPNPDAHDHQTRRLLRGI